jgi:tetratricopeptide (TPR) repeat protein
LLSGIPEEKAVKLASAFDPRLGIFAGECIRQLRAGSNAAPVITLKPIIAKNWEPIFQPIVGAVLTNLLQQIGNPSDAADAYARAVVIRQNARSSEDTQEAFRLLKMSAEQGHPEAQLTLGSIYEAGEEAPADYAEAMKWYLRADASGAPHAGCRIADMIRAGKGVQSDPEEAVKWLSKESERGCGAAQQKLALYYEQRQDVPRSLQYFRQAGTNGVTQAQTALGERLSDGVTTTADFAEAALWFCLAAKSGDRFAGASARRLEEKLTEDERERVEKEAERIFVAKHPQSKSRELQGVHEQMRSLLNRQ